MSDTPLLRYTLRAQAMGRPWITSIVVHGRVLQEQISAATWRAVPIIARGRGVRDGTRFELHVEDVLLELPAGKYWDRPDWTDGRVKVWDCGKQFPESQAAAPAPEITERIAHRGKGGSVR